MLDCQKKAKAKYKAKLSQINLVMFPKDGDINAWLNSQAEPKASYIKRLIREDLKKVKGSAFCKMLDFYVANGWDIESMENDMKSGILTENTTRDGRQVMWYFTETKEYCVDDNGQEMTSAEIEKQLC